MSSYLKRRKVRGQSGNIQIQPPIDTSLTEEYLLSLADDDVKRLWESSKPVEAPLLTPLEIFYHPCPTLCSECVTEKYDRPYACCIYIADWSLDEFDNFQQFKQAVNHRTFPYKYKRFSLHRLLLGRFLK